MFYSKYQEPLYAFLRIVSGILFFWHGCQKILNYPPLPPGIHLPWHMLFIAGPIELLGGLLIAIGLFTHVAAFLASGEMAVAYWSAHAIKHYLPLLNRGELAVLYCFVFLFISAYGSGIWSVDNYLKKRKSLPKSK